jgi:hypothetical protein
MDGRSVESPSMEPTEDVGSLDHRDTPMNIDEAEKDKVDPTWSLAASLVALRMTLWPLGLWRLRLFDYVEYVVHDAGRHLVPLNDAQRYRNDRERRSDEMHCKPGRWGRYWP